MAGGSGNFREMPSRPARNITARARYGLQLGSQQRNSIRADDWRLLLGRGTRISASRFTRPQLTKTGASYPGTRRLYELTRGARMAHIARACANCPAIK